MSLEDPVHWLSLCLFHLHCHIAGLVCFSGGPPVPISRGCPWRESLSFRQGTWIRRAVLAKNLSPCCFPQHVGSTLGTALLITGLLGCVRCPVSTLRTDAITPRDGRVGSAHAACSPSAAAGTCSITTWHKLPPFIRASSFSASSPYTKTTIRRFRAVSKFCGKRSVI